MPTTRGGLRGVWAEALHWNVDVTSHDVVSLVPTDGTRFGIDFVAVPEHKSGKNRIHLDLASASIDDQQETVERLLALRARHIDIGQGPVAPHVVLADPDGNEFCVIEPDNFFLAGRGRLGSITCDGLPRVGYFWSEALGWPLVWDQNQETAIRAGRQRTVHHVGSAGCPESQQGQAASRHCSAKTRRSASRGRPPDRAWSEAN